MTGVEEYNKRYEHKIKKIINTHPQLKGFYAYINKEISSTYEYLRHTSCFLDVVNKPTNELNLADFTSYIKSKGKNKEGKLTTSSYQILCYQALKKYGTYLVACNELKQNPMDFVERPKFKENENTKKKREISYLNSDEITDYINSVRNGCGTERSQSRQEKWRNRDIAIITLFLSTGIRCSALTKLDLSSFDEKNGILITNEKEGMVQEYELSESTVKVLKEYLESRKQLMIGYKKTPALFISNKRTRLSNNSVSAITKKYYNGDDKTISPHKLRASYGTQLYEATKDIYFVQMNMRHSSPTTSELYIRGKKNTSKQANDIMLTVMK